MDAIAFCTKNPEPILPHMDIVRMGNKYGITIKACAERNELAPYDVKTVLGNMKQHNPQSPLLLGRLMDGDIIHTVKQKSWKDIQLKLDL